MNVKFRYIIYFACIICTCFWSFKLSSYAIPNYTIVITYTNHSSDMTINHVTEFRSTVAGGYRYCLYKSRIGNSDSFQFTLYSNQGQTIDFSTLTTHYYPNNTTTSSNTGSISSTSIGNGIYRYNTTLFGYSPTVGDTYSTDLYVFDDLEDVYAYVSNGTLPQLPYDDDLNLDSFKVSYYLWSSTLTSPHYRFNVTWSDPNIYQVQVKIYSTRSSQSWEGQSSPFSNTFIGSTFAQSNGDVVHCVATPYKQDGSYGNSLYYSFTFNGNDPLTNVWRKYNNTPYQNNIIDIPYTGVSGNEVVQAPVDGITQNYNYKVNYNPVTNEYGDLVLNEIYYSPVVIYEDNTPAEIVEQTQTYITNNYTTNNYYDATNNIDYDYDFDFGDVSGSDIQNGYNGVGDFFNGFGTFIGKLANLLSGLFPFLSPAVATWLIAGVAFILALGVIMIFIKIVGAIKDVIPFL